MFHPYVSLPEGDYFNCTSSLKPTPSQDVFRCSEYPTMCCSVQDVSRYVGGYLAKEWEARMVTTRVSKACAAQAREGRNPSTKKSKMATVPLSIDIKF